MEVVVCTAQQLVQYCHIVHHFSHLCSPLIINVYMLPLLVYCCICAHAGFFYHYVTTPARKANFPDPCSEHSLYLEYGSDKGLFSFPKEE
jgi:hypothetical protein